MKFKGPVWTDDTHAIVPIKGQNFFIAFDIEHDMDGVPFKANIVDYVETTFPATQEKDNIRYFYVKWGGYPDFKQGELVPFSDDGREYTYLCTVYNDWGDMGNCNLFLLMGEDGVTIEDVYLEASCS